jgi:hypothetical protein
VAGDVTGLGFAKLFVKVTRGISNPLLVATMSKAAEASGELVWIPICAFVITSNDKKTKVLNIFFILLTLFMQKQMTNRSNYLKKFINSFYLTFFCHKK